MSGACATRDCAIGADVFCAQVVTSMTVMRTLNPTWPLTPPSVFETSSNRKFLICVLWDAPSVVGDPTCVSRPPLLRPDSSTHAR